MSERDRRVLAVVVLFRMAAGESAAFTSLGRILEREVPGTTELELMVCDNTPFEQEAPAGFGGVYWRDTTNPGLARCYNRALGRAVETGAGWLMLLDQDTTVTEEYVAEVGRLVGELEGEAGVVALAPKLIAGGRGVSPHRPPTLRHYRADLGFTGVAKAPLCAFNSGAVLRVRAMAGMGGFREEFWLDFLDHATFRELQVRGGQVYVMASRLEHELALSKPKGATFSVARHRNSVDAECAFYRRFGTLRERMYLRARLLWSAIGGVLKRGEVRRAGYMIGAAMGRPAAAQREMGKG